MGTRTRPTRRTVRPRGDTVGPAKAAGSYRAEDTGFSTRVDKALAAAQNDRSMRKRTPAHFEARARIIKALAHPSRLFIVDELSRKERCVAELTEMVGSDMSTVSKHLSVLKSAGIVDDEKRGSQVIYFLRVPCILKFFDCVGEVLKSVAEQQLESLRDY